MSFICEIFEIFCSKATVASPIPSFFEEEKAFLITGVNYLNFYNIKKILYFKNNLIFKI